MVKRWSGAAVFGLRLARALRSFGNGLQGAAGARLLALLWSGLAMATVRAGLQACEDHLAFAAPHHFDVGGNKTAAAD